MHPTEVFRQARDFLQAHREDYATAVRDFRWPELDAFNWAIDWFDAIAEGNSRTALHLVKEDGGETRLSYAELSARSTRVAAHLRRHGVERGHRVLVMLPNCPELWEVMLALMKLGAVMIPATALLTPADVQDRLRRGNVRHIVTDAAGTEKFPAVDGRGCHVTGAAPVAGWHPYAAADGEPARPIARGPARADDPMLLYFTSGTTARPKLVLHTQRSYAVGHLSTMYWQGLREGDVHWNISSPGWAKHAWSSFFAPPMRWRCSPGTASPPSARPPRSGAC